MFGDEQSIGEIKEKIQEALLKVTHNKGSIILIETLNIHVTVSAQGGGAKVVLNTEPATIFWLGEKG